MNCSVPSSNKIIKLILTKKQIPFIEKWNLPQKTDSKNKSQNSGIENGHWYHNFTDQTILEKTGSYSTKVSVLM